MRIAYCIQDFYRLGGMERILSIKANYLAKHGFEVIIITTDQQGKHPYYPLSDSISCYDLNVNYSRSKNRIQYHNCITMHKEKLSELLYKIKADIVISMFSQETEFLPKIKDGSKKILELHYNHSIVMPRLHGLRGLYHTYKNKRRVKNIKKYDRFVVLTHEDKEAWKGFKNIKVISNPQTFKCDKTASLDNKRVIAVGRYHEVKRYNLLIDAWNIVHQEIKNWTLHIVGEGSLRETLQKQIDTLGLNQTVYLDGASKNIKEEYLKSSILTLTSAYEGFGLVIVEAMTCGLPVVSFDCPCGPSDLINNGINGFLVKSGNIEDLADKLIYLIKHSEERKRMGNEAYRYSDKYSEENIMEQWLSLFEKLKNDKA